MNHNFVHYLNFFTENIVCFRSAVKFAAMSGESNPFISASPILVCMLQLEVSLSFSTEANDEYHFFCPKISGDSLDFGNS